MIKGEFLDTEGPEAIRSSDGDFRFVIESLDHTAGELLFGLEIVEKQLAVRA